MVNWYGFGEDYCLSLYTSEPGNYVDAWRDLLDRVKHWKFNTVRLCFTMPGASGKTTILKYNILNRVLSIIYKRKLKAIITCDYAIFGSENWKTNWINLVTCFKNDKRIVAWELMNEPCTDNSDPSIETIEEATKTLIEMTDLIRNLGDTKRIIYPMTMFYEGKWKKIIISEELFRKNIIITEHAWTYGNPQTIEDAIAIADYRLSNILTYRIKGFDIWVGEVGIHDPPSGGTYEIEKAFAVYIINKSIEEKTGFNWWLYSSNHWHEGSADECIKDSKYIPHRKHIK